MAAIHGKYRFVDLSTGDARFCVLPSEEQRRWLGGVGLGVHLLMEHAPPRVDPLGIDNAVIYAFSPLVGSPLTTSAKFAVVTKSPLTGRITDALSSSHFALAGKRSGMDALVISGRADSWSVLVIDDDAVRLEPASSFLGMSAADTETALREQLGNRFRISAIGPAGEAGVLYATLSNEGRHAGRGGIGAVMGSKRLKAVAVAGTQKVAPASPAETTAFSKELSSRSLGPATEKYQHLGTASNLFTFNRLNALPTRNFQDSEYEGAEAFSTESLDAIRGKARASCAACTIGCEHLYPSQDGGVRVEYESLFAMGPLIGCTERALIVRAINRCDRWGLDTISTGGSIAWAMQCREEGVLPGGPTFGDGTAVLELIDAIGSGSSELGRLLALGSREAARRTGQGSDAWAMHVKGLELPGYEPRTLHAMALGLAVGTRGADHNRSGAYEADFQGRTDRFAGDERSVRAAIELEDRAAIMDSLILCKFLRGVFDDFLAEAAEMLRLVCGWDLTRDELEETARRIVNARKAFNIREGWTKEEDTLPDRILEQSLQTDGGPRSLTADQLKNMIGQYYLLRGWTADGLLSESTDPRLPFPEKEATWQT